MVIYFATAQILFKKKIILSAVMHLLLKHAMVIIQLWVPCLDLHCCLSIRAILQNNSSSKTRFYSRHQLRGLDLVY